MKKEILSKLENELAGLENELKHKIPEELSRATAYGDLTDNAEYEAIKLRQKFIESRILQLRQRVQSLASLDIDSIPRDRVGFGSTVYLRNLETGEEKVYQLVTAEEVGKKPGNISVSSPIGRAVQDGEVGDEVEVKLPAGTRRYQIEKIVTIHDQK